MKLGIKEFQKHIDKKIEFVQDNMSFQKNAIRIALSNKKSSR